MAHMSAQERGKRLERMNAAAAVRLRLSMLAAGRTEVTDLLEVETS